MRLRMKNLLDKENAIRQNLDREQSAPNALVVDDNNRPWKVLRGHGHQYAPHAFQAFGFAVVAAPEKD